jgi:AraC-like DNA-binding protein
MPVPALRGLLAQVFGDLARRLRTGEVPMAIPEAPARPQGAHWHAWPELFIQLSGRSRFATPQGELAVAAGSCLLFPPLLAHEEYVDPRAGAFANLVVTLGERRLSYHLAMPGQRDRRRPAAVLPDVIEDETMVTATACLAGLARSPDEDARRGLLLAICGLARQALLAMPAPGSGGSDQVRLVRGMVQSRLGSPHLSVAQLASWMGRHPDHLTRLFRRETGETLVGHIQRQRLARARALLADPRLRVRDVARLVGFEDPAYFSRVWRRAHGGSPGRLSGRG